MSPPNSPPRYNPIGWLSDLQERPLLPLRFNPLQPTNFKGRSTLGSRLITLSGLLVLIGTAVVVDRHLFRNLGEPALLWETNYHLTNAVVSRVCNILPSSSTSSSSSFASQTDGTNRTKDSFNGLLASKFCRNQLNQKKDLEKLYVPDSGHDFGPSMDRSMGSERCAALFPNLYQELDRAVLYHSSRGNISIQHLDRAYQYSHARVLIYRNRVYIKGFNGGPGLRTEAILNSIQEAVITSPELLPDVEFVIKTSDAPQGGDDEHPLWVLDRTKSQEEVWLMPDYGFYSWPEPKVGGMVEVRDKTAEREASLSWDSKISKAFWRGAILVKLREQLLEVSKGKSWSDIKPIVWQNLNGGLKTPEDHCNYKFLVHTEGYAYSGRLKYLLMCRSVVVGHEMQYIQGGDPTTSNNMSGVDMYVTEGSLPAVDTSLAERLTKLVDTLIPRMESLERAVSGQASKPAGVTRADSFNTLLVRIEEIAANMTRLEKKVEALSSPLSSNMTDQTAAKPSSLPPRPAPLYSEKVAGTSKPGVAKPLPPVPPSSYINRFKLGQVVIRKKFDQPKPFEGLTAAAICQKINAALEFAKAKVDNEVIKIKAVAQFPNGDVKIFTKDRRASKWLLDNKHLWTEKADPVFITSQVAHPVLLHSCPTSFEVDNGEHVELLCKQNDIEPKEIQKIRWLLNPKGTGKASSTLLIFFFDRRLALDIERAGLCYNSLHLKGQHYLQGPKQCYNCLALHVRKWRTLAEAASAASN
ncbi:hypothetical protein PGTUg99_018850 [Puccinia graminis f. sp. tritici]|uniref:Glycosyl transferase CAP10 domain-containing protein n=1 Tax=Puccinia graminis f. sp. tritici TaxID=56615 RepID=A0A5B0S116_PUCGR|nr:hypothetical protein PGTUg99_018850 [Puccinia graminis f. sp. tritici]